MHIIMREEEGSEAMGRVGGKRVKFGVSGGWGGEVGRGGRERKPLPPYLVVPSTLDYLKVP